MFIAIVCVTLLIGGYWWMPKQQYPEVVLLVASITVIYPGAFPEDVEELAAKLIEETVMSLNGFDSCSTHVYENACAIMVMLYMDLS